jgi:hypothetical protein
VTVADDLRALSVGYASAVDRLDGPAFAALFTPDGELWVPGGGGDRTPTTCRAGTEALTKIPSGLRRYHATYHRVGATDYRVDGDEATGEVHGVAHHLGDGADTVWYLRYADDYRRTDGRWRIARRVLHLDSVEQRPVTDLGPGR